MAWNPEQYLKFSQPRLRPAVDLLARVAIAAPSHVYDLGCGAGNITRLLGERWPRATITGVDDSPTMLAQAAKVLPHVRWLNKSIASWQADMPADVIYSNAALHWLSGHNKLFPAIVSNLAPGGVLAVQMPNNFAAPSHALIGETVRSSRWSGNLETLLTAEKVSPVASQKFYYDILAPLASHIDIWETEYLQILDGKDPVKEWTKGTWLKQFLDRLDAAERNEFEADYARRLAEAYPPQADGKTLLPFRRLFIVLQKA